MERSPIIFYASREATKGCSLAMSFYSLREDRSSPPRTMTDEVILWVFGNLSTILYTVSRTETPLHCHSAISPMKTVASNRRARFDYDIVETIEAGLVLTGPEVKSCRLGHIDLSGAYVSFLHDKPALKQCKISPYPFAAATEILPIGRDKPLLLKKAEAEKLQTLLSQKGISVIPLEVKAGKYIKVVIGIGKGRKTIDKRKVIKERDIKKRLKKGEEI